MLRKASLPLTLLCTLAFSLVVPALAQAQSKKGDSEVLLFGFVFMNPKDAGNTASGNFTFNYGAFFTDHAEVGGGPSISVSSGATGGVDATMGVNFFYRQHFGAARTQPYVGGEVFVQDVQDSDTTYLDAIFGVKNYLSEHSALDFKVAYGTSATTPTLGERQQLLVFSVGLTVLF
jgi:hypothetical protein